MAESYQVFAESQPLPGPAGSPAPQEDCLSPLLMFGLWGWVLAVAWGRILAEVAVSGMFTAIPSPLFTLLPAGEALLLLVPLAPLAIFWRNPRYRAIFVTWALAAFYVLLLAPIHLTPQTATNLQGVLHIILSVIFVFLVRFIARRTVQPEPEAPGTAAAPEPGLLSQRFLLMAAVFSGVLLAYPWLAWGALGSLVDTLVQFLAALAFGAAAAALLELLLFRPLTATSTGLSRDFFLGGFTAATALLILISGLGFSFGGLQMVMMIALPGLGFALVGLSQLGRLYSPVDSLSATPAARYGRAGSLRPLAALVGLAAAAPMLLIDPDELALMVSLAPGELLSWALKAAGVVFGLSGLISLLVFLLVLAARTRAELIERARPALTALTAVALVGALVAGAAVYFVVGQPGFYGEGLFVILDDQADLSAAAQISDPLARRTYVYETLAAHSRDSQAGLLQQFDQLGMDYTSYYLINAVQVQGGPLTKLWLSTRPEVDRVLDNPWMRPLPDEPGQNLGSLTSPVQSADWNLTLIHANRVWHELGITGEGVVVGQSDSGVQWDHPELQRSYRGWNGSNAEHDYNWLDPWFHTQEPRDLGGHGTHTTGSIVGENVGVAPGATWYGCVNLARNLGNPALYLECMQFMLAPFPLAGDPLADGDPAQGAHVINNSWGCPDLEGCDPNALLVGFEALRAAGVFVVVSAGNDGPGCDSLEAPPAIYDSVFSVGAINSVGNLAFFSSIGPVTSDGSNRVKPDIVAPGESVFSSMPGSTYTYNSGTSMAGPHVVGVVALMWSANPALIGDIERTEAILIQTATPYRGVYPDCPGVRDSPSTAVGFGVINAYEAVRLALEERNQ